MGMPPLLIGLAGRKGSGKSTVALAMERLGMTRASFSSPIKFMLMSVGLSEEDLYGSRKEVPNPILHGKTPRYAMQTLGVEWGRKLIGEDLWVGIGMRQALSMMEIAQTGSGEYRGVVFDDVRFPNEVEAIRAAGGFVYRIVRPSLHFAQSLDQHDSEAFIDLLEVSAQIVNEGSVEELEQQAAFLLDVASLNAELRHRAAKKAAVGPLCFNPISGGLA